jgi:ABC-type uncharacterized transport system ATPase subunit
VLKLRQVELLGFKSFPHKTVVDLDVGVTCVVGPNGSGKSNLADAINFAFGSQSAQLRAHKLAGLIFAGTDQLRPLNLASVATSSAGRRRWSAPRTAWPGWRRWPTTSWSCPRSRSPAGRRAASSRAATATAAPS